MSDFGISLTFKKRTGANCTEDDCARISGWLRENQGSLTDQVGDKAELEARPNSYDESGVCSANVILYRYWFNDLRDIHGIDLEGVGGVGAFLSEDLITAKSLLAALETVFGDAFDIELYAGGW